MLHPDVLAAARVPGGALISSIRQGEAGRDAKPVTDGPAGLHRSRNSWLHFHGLAADVLAHLDIFMVEFLVEKTGYVFPGKVEFLLCLPGARR